MNEHVKTRNELIDYLERDQFGPYDGYGELLPENPLRRYMVGILHPQGSIFEEKDDDGGPGRELGTENDDSELGLRMSNTVAPSSYGMTFACSEPTEKILIFVGAGIYMPIQQDQLELDSSPQGCASLYWMPKEIKTEFEVKISQTGDKRFWVIKNKFSLRARIRPIDNSGNRSVTISVVNEQNCPERSNQDEKAQMSFFHVCFGAKGIDGSKPFVNRIASKKDNTISEDNSLRLLYRHINTFAIGHGCATDWEEEIDRRDCWKIVSSFVPKHTVHPMVQPLDLGLPVYSIKGISESTSAELQKQLTIIPDKYNIWIRKLRKQFDELDEYLRPQAEEHLKQCSIASDRIRSGIRLLTQDKEVFKAFTLMHRAMLHQIAHSKWLKEGRPLEGPQLEDDHAWYPFQIAFILQCLESLANPESTNRDLVDLLWFPTGGGKTEAYLGIIAFLIFLRRVRSIKGVGNGGGTVALMRYTLRLLTVDQFYRAALLACSCELIRRDSMSGLSETNKISIGLWVGGEASPNSWQEAREALEEINAGREEPKKGNPLKVRECPWCGEEIGSADYTLPDNQTSMLIECPNQDCDFHEGLPVWVTDSDVYRNRPSLIIGTVDKFARIPWVNEAGRIFGSDGKTDPPDVIIQDELHLISGPLGTMVGLYETAVNALCQTKEGNSPKVIASTATIRNAEGQVNSLFCRGVKQFPPPGIEYSDSFFAREDRKKPGREYVGVFTPGTSPTTALVRTFAILLHAAKKAECSDEVRDAYWTLMAYFNSLRELGGASVQVDDDVNDYLKICAERDNDRLNLRQVENKSELTGRVDSTVLDEIRTNLWEQFPDEECPDVVLATNMISVGLDVPRLGLMAVVGQPKSTSEYIQATSRIGRRYPGLVVTLYNWTRSRDRSHFERFKAYHAKLYSEVEATSVTPFSSRARDRGLHAVLISIIRHLVDGMHRNSDAANIGTKIDIANDIAKNIIDRVTIIDSQEVKNTEKALNEIINRWFRLAAGNPLHYKKNRRRDDRLSLMISAETASATSPSFGTLNSLRNIDPAAGLNLEG